MCARTREASKVRAAHPSYKISGALRDAGNIYGRRGVLGRWDRLLTRMDKVLQNVAYYRYPEPMGRDMFRPCVHAARADTWHSRHSSGGTMRKRALLPAALLLAVAGCSGGGSGPAEPSASQSAPSPTATTSTAGSQTPAESAPATTPPSLPTDVSTSLNAIDALQKHTCTADANGSWTFKGTLVNKSDRAKTYSVAVAVTVGAAVQGHALITETVQPGKSADVSAENFAKTAGQEGTCEPVVSVEDAS
jgi:hypothetical protein